jgi:hypothetical protein
MMAAALANPFCASMEPPDVSSRMARQSKSWPYTPEETVSDVVRPDN